MKRTLNLIFAIVLAALSLCTVAPAQDQEISVSGTVLQGELYTGLSGRLNELVNVLGTKVNLDINAFSVTNPRNGAVAAGFSLTGRMRLAENGWLYGGPALKWEQGQRSTIGLAIGLLVTVSNPSPPDPDAWVVVWREGSEPFKVRRSALL